MTRSIGHPETESVDSCRMNTGREERLSEEPDELVDDDRPRSKNEGSRDRIGVVGSDALASELEPEDNDSTDSHEEVESIDIRFWLFGRVEN